MPVLRVVYLGVSKGAGQGSGSGVPYTLDFAFSGGHERSLDMLRKAGIATIVAVTLLLFVSAFTATKAGPPKKDEGTDLNGKIVYAVSKGTDKGGHMLKDVHVKQLGDRAFLVGKYCYYEGDDKTPEMVYWLPVDELKHLTVFNSREDAKVAADRSEKTGQ
jgi:hypothetical protein